MVSWECNKPLSYFKILSHGVGVKKYTSPKASYLVLEFLMQMSKPLLPFSSFNRRPSIVRILDFPWNQIKVCNWSPIIENFQEILSSYKARNLSYGGRLTLIKSFLRALGTYFFSLFKAPKCVLLYLEKLRRKLFLSESLESNKLAWINWKKRFALHLVEVV